MKKYPHAICSDLESSRILNAIITPYLFVVSYLFVNPIYGVLNALSPLNSKRLNCWFYIVVNESVEILAVLFVFAAVDDTRCIDRMIDGQNTVEVIYLVLQ